MLKSKDNDIYTHIRTSLVTHESKAFQASSEELFSRVDLKVIKIPTEQIFCPSIFLVNLKQSYLR